MIEDLSTRRSRLGGTAFRELGPLRLSLSPRESPPHPSLSPGVTSPTATVGRCRTKALPAYSAPRPSLAGG